MKETDKQRRTRKPTAVRRQEIICAGMRILTSEGARQFTADRLGSEVGMTGGTVFRHFVSMDEILDAIVDRIEEIIFADFPPQADDPLQRLRLFFEARVKAISEHPEVSKLLLTDTLIPDNGSEDRGRRVLEFKLRSRRFVIDCLKKARADGRINQDISNEEGSILILGSIYAIGHMGIGVKKKSVELLSERIWRIHEETLTNTN